VKADLDANLIVYFDGKYMPYGEAHIGIMTHALHYGTGVFEGIRAHWDDAERELYLMRPVEHYQRWRQNCGILHIDVPLSPEDLCAITVELARRNKFDTDLYIRPLAYKCAERVGVAIDDQDAFFIVAMPFGEYLHSEGGLHAGVSAWRRIEDNAIPARGKICGAYANSALASDDARRSGFDEAILLNEDGHVTEGATCNLFMVRKGCLITPAISERVLEGITRDAVIELAAHEFGLKIEERPVDRSELYVCDELFLTGTAVGVAPVVRVDHRTVANGAIGPVTHSLRQAYFLATHGRMPAYRNWLVPVYGESHWPEHKEMHPAETGVA
jgi:branched-chain amino acid aminotransferase